MRDERCHQPLQHHRGNHLMPERCGMSAVNKHHVLKEVAAMSVVLPGARRPVTRPVVCGCVRMQCELSRRTYQSEDLPITYPLAATWKLQQKLANQLILYCCSLALQAGALQGGGDTDLFAGPSRPSNGTRASAIDTSGTSYRFNNG